MEASENGNIGKWKLWLQVMQIFDNIDWRMLFHINIGPHRYIIQPQVIFYAYELAQPLVALQLYQPSISQSQAVFTPKHEHTLWSTD